MTTTQAANSSLAAAKVSNEDEFYTQLSDIEKELRHYRKHFIMSASSLIQSNKTPWSKGGKTVAENCVMLGAADNRKKWDI